MNKGKDEEREGDPIEGYPQILQQDVSKACEGASACGSEDSPLTWLCAITNGSNPCRPKRAADQLGVGGKKRCEEKTGSSSPCRKERNGETRTSFAWDDITPVYKTLSVIGNFFALPLPRKSLD
jgi:hypothetical protein